MGLIVRSAGGEQQHLQRHKVLKTVRDEFAEVGVWRVARSTQTFSVSQCCTSRCEWYEVD